MTFTTAIVFLILTIIQQVSLDIIDLKLRPNFANGKLSACETISKGKIKLLIYKSLKS